MAEPLYRLGEIVRHARLGYRCVVYEIREEGGPVDDWLNPGESLKNKECAWYRVLVDKGGHSALLAEHELVQDETGAEIENPRVDDVFEGFEDGRYSPRIL